MSQSPAPSPANRRDIPVRLIVGVVVSALVVFVAGMWVGNEVPWGTKTPQTYVGKAFLHNTENYLTTFESDDGDLLIGFEATEPQWEAGGKTYSDGMLPPGCLREGRMVPVDLSVVKFEPPGGGQYTSVVWARCR